MARDPITVAFPREPRIDAFETTDHPGAEVPRVALRGDAFQRVAKEIGRPILRSPRPFVPGSLHQLTRGWEREPAKGEKDDLRSGMNLGADDYLTKPVANADLVDAIEARLRRSEVQAKREFKPDFSSTEPLKKLGLTPRATEALLWLAQGKTNSDIATILGVTESTVKKHVQEMFEKLGVETRVAATVRALEALNLRTSSNA